MLIVLSGQARSGKDTAASILKSIFINKNETCIAVAYADFLKDILRKCFNLTDDHLYGELKETPIKALPIRTRSGRVTNHLWTTRKLMQFLGTDVFRTLDPDCWINVVKNFVETYSNYDNIIITDARFDNEIKWVLERNGIHIRIVREDKDFSSNTDHASENSVSYVEINTPQYYCIDNNEDLLYLENKLLTIIDKEKHNGR